MSKCFNLLPVKSNDSNTAEEGAYLEYTSTKCLKSDVMAGDKYGYITAGTNEVARGKETFQVILGVTR